MKFFKIFGKNAASNGTEDNHTPSKELFIEEDDVNNINGHSKTTLFGLEKIYEYAATDFEDKGYSDALVNPDFSYSQDNLKLLRHDLQIKIKRAYKTYEDYIKDLNFHIESRRNAGLVDTVRLLESKLSKITDSIEEVKKIEEDFVKNEGLVERITLSYKRGFTRGLAAMSDEILEKDV
jgi:hypothetical protein